jgi:pimeloyl-ACP methyl ester carboxylesterase
LSDGRDLAVQFAGPPDGKAVFAFHGIPGSRLLPPAVETVATEFGVRFIGTDRPGFGRSDFQHGRTILDWPIDVAELADALGLDRFAVLGISSGSAYALAVALKLPDRVTRVGIAAGVTPKDLPVIRHKLAGIRVARPALWAIRRSPRLARAVYGFPARGLTKVPERAMAAMASGLSAPDQRALSRPEVAAYVLAMIREGLRAGGRGWAHGEMLLDADWGFEPSDISPDVPIHLWHGAEDSEVPVAHVERLTAELRNAELHVFPGEGHFSVTFNRLREIVRVLAGEPVAADRGPST